MGVIQTPSKFTYIIKCFTKNKSIKIEASDFNKHNLQ